MARKHFNLTAKDEEHAHHLLDRLNELGVDPVNFLSNAVRAEEELPGDRRAYSGRDLVALIARIIPRRSGGTLDEDGYHGPLDPSPWHSPTIQGSLYALRFNLPLLAEILRAIANEVDPPAVEKRPGRPRSAIRDHERRSATLRLFIERLRLTSARRSREPEEDPRIREALALRLDANETAAVLAFAVHTKLPGPLANVAVDKALRYFNTARKGKKPTGFVRRRSEKKSESSRKKQRQEPPSERSPRCPDPSPKAERPERAPAPPEGASSSGDPRSQRKPTPRKAGGDGSKKTVSGPRSSASAASASTTARKPSPGSAGTRQTPRRPGRSDAWRPRGGKGGAPP